MVSLIDRADGRDSALHASPVCSPSCRGGPPFPGAASGVGRWPWTVQWAPARGGAARGPHVDGSCGAPRPSGGRSGGGGAVDVVTSVGRRDAPRLRAALGQGDERVGGRTSRGRRRRGARRTRLPSAGLVAAAERRAVAPAAQAAVRRRAGPAQAAPLGAPRGPPPPSGHRPPAPARAVRAVRTGGGRPVAPRRHAQPRRRRRRPRQPSGAGDARSGCAARSVTHDDRGDDLLPRRPAHDDPRPDRDPPGHLRPRRQGARPRARALPHPRRPRNPCAGAPSVAHRVLARGRPATLRLPAPLAQRRREGHANPDLHHLQRLATPRVPRA